MSWHDGVHTVAFFEAFSTRVAAIFVFVRRFGACGQRGWMIYSAATGVAPFPLIAASQAGASGVVLFVMGVITSTWVAALPARLMSERVEAER